MKRIKLTQGKFALVDDCDFKWLNQWRWYAQKGRNTYYAARSTRNHTTKKQQVICMHRLILNTPTGMESDHRDGNGLKNTRSNLRICTTSQNQHNQLPQKNTGSKYKGVWRYKKDNKWGSQIQINGKSINLGSFINEIDAALAYDAKARELFGEFAYLNFSQ